MVISTLIGKKIFSPMGEELGYVKGVYLTKKLNAISCLNCVDGEEDEFYLPARALVSVEDAVVASAARVKEGAGINCPIGKPVYSKNGEFLGTVSEVTLRRNLAEFYIKKDGATRKLSAAQLVFSDVGIVRAERISEQAQPEKIERVAPRKITPKKVERQAEIPQNEVMGPVQKSALSYGNDLLGKTVKCDVISDGKTLISAGEVITPVLIRKASQNNKLLELSLNTLQK